MATKSADSSAVVASELDASRYVMVSVDSHVGPSVRDQLREYCERRYLAAYDDYLAQYEQRVAEFSGKTVTPGFTQPDGWRERYERSAAIDGNADVAARLRDMDLEGVAAEVVFHGSQNEQGIPFVDFRRYGACDFGPELRAEGFRIFNRWLADFVAAAPERLVGVAQIPMWDVELAAREAEWARGAGLRCVNFPPDTSPTRPPYNDPAWEPFWHTCEALEMPLTTHAGGGETGQATRPAYTGPEASALWFAEFGFFGSRCLWYLVFGGVFERHPRLKLVFTETTAEWIPLTLRDLDSIYRAPRHSHLWAALPRTPSEYWSTNCFAGASFLSHREALLAPEIGICNLMWGRDYPHEEGTFPYTTLSLRKTFAGIDPADVRRVIGENAIGVYGLDPAPLPRSPSASDPRWRSWRHRRVRRRTTSPRSASGSSGAGPELGARVVQHGLTNRRGRL